MRYSLHGHALPSELKLTRGPIGKTITTLPSPPFNLSLTWRSVMKESASPRWGHAQVDRRFAVRAGLWSLAGLSTAELTSLRAANPPVQKTGETVLPFGQAKSAIYIFLSGGLGQHDSFDPKPAAPDKIRGEFKPIATRSPGVSIVEHLPKLAACSPLWSLIRSLTHKSNDHSASHHMMLTLRSDLPAGFQGNKPQPGDHPCIAALAGSLVPRRNNLPPAIVLPEKLVHNSGRVLPGQFAGTMGPRREPWFLEASPFSALRYGAFPGYDFDHQDRTPKDAMRVFRAPSLDLPHELANGRVESRLGLRQELEHQVALIDSVGPQWEGSRQLAASLLTKPKVRKALDVTSDTEQERYGKNAFGWSLLMARRMVELGIPLVHVNLGNNETWDTHGNAFPHLKDKLYPPFDLAVSTLLQDLNERGLLQETLVFIAGEFGRTPRISLLPEHYKLPGRDHWGAAQTVLLAGGGVSGGKVFGATDKDGAYPKENPVGPDDLAATLYHALGIAQQAMWNDSLDRPHRVYHGSPIAGI